jgi:hypothetical protein
MPRIFDDAAECVGDTLTRIGSNIVLALPSGIGKPNPLANQFYRRARRNGGKNWSAASWSRWRRGCSAHAYRSTM